MSASVSIEILKGGLIEAVRERLLGIDFKRSLFDLAPSYEPNVASVVK